jgi:hypothetical protein
LEHQGSTQTSGGKTSTRSDTWQKDGSNLTHEGTTTGTQGGTVTRNDAWAKEGSTISHQGSGSRQPSTKTWAPTYKDESDIFGGRSSPLGKASGRKAVGGGGRRR